jgi:hypothetical protein
LKNEPKSFPAALFLSVAQKELKCFDDYAIKILLDIALEENVN